MFQSQQLTPILMFHTRFHTSSWKLASSAEIAVAIIKPKTGTEWMGNLVKRPTNNSIMETGPGFIVQSLRLDVRNIELATIRMQYRHDNHCITAAPKTDLVVNCSLMDPGDTHMGSPVGHERARPRSGARLIGSWRWLGYPARGSEHRLTFFYRERQKL